MMFIVNFILDGKNCCLWKCGIVMMVFCIVFCFWNVWCLVFVLVGLLLENMYVKFNVCSWWVCFLLVYWCNLCWWIIFLCVDMMFIFVVCVVSLWNVNNVFGRYCCVICLWKWKFIIMIVVIFFGWSFLSC